MTQPNLLELAKQGNPQAIASLINRQLEPKGITAKANLSDNCLHIFLESAQVPDRHSLLELVRKGMTNLEPQEIERVRVYGQKTGDPSPAWTQEFGLEVGAYSMLTFVPPANSPEPTQSRGVESQQQEVVNPKSYKQIAAGIIAAALLLAALVLVSHKLIKTNGDAGKPTAPAAPATQPRSRF